MGVLTYYYRPQTKFAKVMFLHVSVILSTGGGVSRPIPGGGCGVWPGGVSRPIPRGEFEGSGRRGFPGPGPGGYPSIH